MCIAIYMDSKVCVYGGWGGGGGRGSYLVQLRVNSLFIILRTNLNTF